MREELHVKHELSVLYSSSQACVVSGRKNNWPPLPEKFPVNPCFYHDITVDIPVEFQKTVKIMYYLWMCEYFSHTQDVYCVVMKCQGSKGGELTQMNKIICLQPSRCQQADRSSCRFLLKTTVRRFKSTFLFNTLDRQLQVFN